MRNLKNKYNLLKPYDSTMYQIRLVSGIMIIDTIVLKT